MINTEDIAEATRCPIVRDVALWKFAEAHGGRPPLPTQTACSVANAYPPHL
jgi:hypothetical protein